MRTGLSGCLRHTSSNCSIGRVLRSILLRCAERFVTMLEWRTTVCAKLLRVCPRRDGAGIGRLCRLCAGATALGIPPEPCADTREPGDPAVRVQLPQFARGYDRRSRRSAGQRSRFVIWISGRDRKFSTFSTIFTLRYSCRFRNTVAGEFLFLATPLFDPAEIGTCPDLREWRNVPRTAGACGFVISL
jgi:hypothetical protein